MTTEWLFQKPSGNSNGNTFDYQGRQISCQHAPEEGLSDRIWRDWNCSGFTFNGKKFNSPNDVIIHRNDDSIWFTDPSYDHEKLYWHKTPSELKEAVYRIDAREGEQVTDDILKPNGLCFRPI